MTIFATLLLDRRSMTKGRPEAVKERAWVDDHHRHHHRGEGINVTTPGTDQAPTLAAA
jgi:hypothetical protein